jgi:TolA-binding protein
MAEPDQDTPGAPNEPLPRATTGSLAILGVDAETFRSWLRVAFGMGLATLLVADIFQYSLHQALHARVENQERRIERLNKMVDDLLTTNQNAQKIEKIEQQVEGIDGQIHDLTESIKAQDAKADASEALESERKKR